MLEALPDATLQSVYYFLLNMTDEVVGTGASSTRARISISALNELLDIMIAFVEDLDHVFACHSHLLHSGGVCLNHRRRACLSFRQDLRYVFRETVVALRQMCANHPHDASLRDLSSVIMLGPRAPAERRSCQFYDGNSYTTHRRSRTAVDYFDNDEGDAADDDEDDEDDDGGESSSVWVTEDEDCSDVETVSFTGSEVEDTENEYSDDEDEEYDDVYTDGDEELDEFEAGNDCMSSDSDIYDSCSYSRDSDRGSTGDTIEFNESDSSYQESFMSDELFDEFLEDWTKTTRLANPCHVLEEKVITQLASKDYIPQWFDVVDLVLESDEQNSRGPANHDALIGCGARTAVNDVNELMCKQRLRDDCAEMVSLIETASESTRLEITATTLFTCYPNRVSRARA